MSRIAFVNGRYVPHGQALIHIEDRGYQFADGVYDGPTALAAARFQKQAGLNVDGVVDAATRDKLGIKPPPAPPPTASATPRPGKSAAPKN